MATDIVIEVKILHTVVETTNSIRPGVDVKPNSYSFRSNVKSVLKVSFLYLETWQFAVRSGSVLIKRTTQSKVESVWQKYFPDACCSGVFRGSNSVHGNADCKEKMDLLRKKLIPESFCVQSGRYCNCPFAVFTNRVRSEISKNRFKAKRKQK